METWTGRSTLTLSDHLSSRTPARPARDPSRQRTRVPDPSRRVVSATFQGRQGVRGAARNLRTAPPPPTGGRKRPLRPRARPFPLFIHSENTLGKLPMVTWISPCPHRHAPRPRRHGAHAPRQIGEDHAPGRHRLYLRQGGPVHRRPRRLADEPVTEPFDPRGWTTTSHSISH